MNLNFLIWKMGMLSPVTSITVMDKIYRLFTKYLEKWLQGSSENHAYFYVKCNEWWISVFIAHQFLFLTRYECLLILPTLHYPSSNDHSSTYLCSLKLLNFKQIINKPINKSIHRYLCVLSICISLGSIISTYFCYTLGNFTSLEFLFYGKNQVGPLSFQWFSGGHNLLPQQILGNVWVYFYCHNWRDGILLASLGCCYISYTA